MGKKSKPSLYNPDVELAKGATLTMASYDTTQRIESISDKVTVGGKPGIAKITGIATGQHDASINGTLSLWFSIFRYMRPDGSIDHVAGWNIIIRLKAGETAIEALNKNDFSNNILALYQKKLENSFIIKDLKSYKNIMEIVHSRAQSYLGYYPHKIAELFKMFTTVESIPKRDKYRAFIKSIFKDRSLSELFKDAIGFIKIGLGVLK